MKNTTVEECQEVIAEFDSNQDRSMAYDEFLNMILPATNPSLRNYCLYGYRVPSHYNDKSRPLSVSITSLVIRILEAEKKLCGRRMESRMELFKHVDHAKLKSFNLISRGQTYISMADLIYFLE